MTTIALKPYKFDTLTFSKKLKAAGVPEKQADAQAEAQADLLSEIFEDSIASKQDIQELKIEMREMGSKLDKLDTKIQCVETKLEHKLREMSDKLTIRLGSMIVVIH